VKILPLLALPLTTLCLARGRAAESPGKEPFSKAWVDSVLEASDRPPAPADRDSSPVLSAPPPREEGVMTRTSGGVPRFPPAAFHAEGRLSPALFDDFQFGVRLGAGIVPGGMPVELIFDFEARPYAKAVRVRESPTLEYQFRENRYHLGPGLSWSVPLVKELSWWTFAGGTGISFGAYRGSSREPETRFPLWFETGYRLMIGRGAEYLGLSYQYFPLPSASPHRLSVQYGVRLGG
jgi:hypothetical protein